MCKGSARFRRLETGVLLMSAWAMQAGALCLPRGTSDVVGSLFVCDRCDESASGSLWDG